ncbi:hypothetical protein SA496_03705 [Pseudomonas sp. JS3066]|uniref:hypothetical protein n=1 Tax=unclassified Pseudomonas TaxID=196821 RepID=UPI00129D708E|nr:MULTISPECIES: hypothetical protein [unclassified Pseudomonas]WVK94300.1 hypothetical protein SA496_03705 [Pseudomonas sp. JS3066]
MKTRRKLFLAVIICAFGAAYAAILMRPLPQPLAVTQYCPPAYPSCAIPVASIGSMLH